MKIFKILIIKQALEIFKLNKLFHGSEKDPAAPDLHR